MPFSLQLLDLILTIQLRKVKHMTCDAKKWRLTNRWMTFFFSAAEEMTFIMGCEECRAPQQVSLENTEVYPAKGFIEMTLVHVNSGFVLVMIISYPPACLTEPEQ